MSWLGPIVLNDEVAVPNVAPEAAAENLQESMLALIGRFTVPDVYWWRSSFQLAR